LADVWLPANAGNGPANFYFYNPVDGLCYYLDFEDEESEAPGTILQGWQAIYADALITALCGGGGGDPPVIDVCEDAILALGNNDKIYIRINSITRPPEPGDWDEGTDGPWLDSLTPVDAVTAGESFPLNYTSGPSAYVKAGDGSTRVACHFISDPYSVLTCSVHLGNFVDCSSEIPWDDVIGTHTLGAASDGTTVNVTYSQTPF
jgi:hypothetical protein